MQTLTLLVFLLSSGSLSAGLAEVKKVAEVVADIYQHLQRGCIFLMNSHAHRQGEDYLDAF
jgi:hypothetical protein